MNIKNLAVEFLVVFAVALLISAIVSFLWNIIRYGESVIEWDFAFCIAIIFGIILTWVKARKIKEI
jgi:uncharacterized membrane protein YwaF